MLVFVDFKSCLPLFACGPSGTFTLGVVAPSSRPSCSCKSKRVKNKDLIGKPHIVHKKRGGENRICNISAEKKH